MSEWTEGVCGDGAVILRDGQPVPIPELLMELKRIAELEAALEQIASCEKRCDGDVVDIARKVLKK